MIDTDPVPYNIPSTVEPRPFGIPARITSFETVLWNLDGSSTWLTYVRVPSD